MGIENPRLFKHASRRCYHFTARSGHRPPAKKSGSLARLSKLGYCSRSHAWVLLQQGRVRANGAIERNPEHAVELGRARIEAANRLASNPKST